MDFNFNHLFAGGAILAVIASLWSRIRMLALVVMGRMIVTIDLEKGAAKAVTHYAFKHMSRGRLGGSRRYTSVSGFIRCLRRHQAIALETIGKEPLIFWEGWKPMVLHYHNSKGGEILISGDLPVRLSFVRGVFDADTFIIRAMDAFNEDRHRGIGTRFRVEKRFGHRHERLQQGGTPATMASRVDDEVSYDKGGSDSRMLKWTPDDVGVPLAAGDPFEVLALSKAVHDVIEDGRRWLASEDWYREKRIPWRMGWLFHGAPGGGKSSTAKACGQALDLPVFVFDLSTFTNREFMEMWSRILQQTPCIALIEDIDAVFQGRENVTNSDVDADGLTFDCLLNCIGGVTDTSGVLLIITTNKVEHLDDALGRPDPNHEGMSTRPGRIDRVVELPLLSEAGRRHIAKRILSDCPERIEEVVKSCDGYSGAQFEYHCGQIALTHYWANAEDKTRP